MSIVFPRDVQARLIEIEALEGMPALETVHQAVTMWTVMTADERRMMGGQIIQFVVARLQNVGRT